MPERSTIRALARDVIGLAGLASVTYGSWLIYTPAGFVVAGLIAVAFCIGLTLQDS